MSDKHEDTNFFRIAPVRTVLAGVAFVNWFVFAAVTLSIGGVSIGTRPSADGFVVTSHGRLTAVSESTWLFSFYYPLLTLTLTPILWLALAATQRHKLRGAGRWLVYGFVTVWCLGWYFAMTRDAYLSITDYLNLPPH